MSNVKFADNLKQLLEANSMKQKELAEKLGTTQQTVSRWINKTNQPDFETLFEICKIFGETPNSLLGFDE